MGYEPRPERPKVEPEILPPEQEDMPPPRRSHVMWLTLNRDARYGSVSAPGSLILVLVLLVVGVLVGATVMLLLGAVLLWLPVIGTILLVLLVSSLLRSLLARGLGRRS
jgi:hypothetical protein